MPQKRKELLKHAKAMRSEPTPAEARLWYYLRARRFQDMKFVRQKPTTGAIVDFIARSRKLIIEVDGDTHTDQSRDDRRAAWLTAQGYRVLRFTNADVMMNLDGVLQDIRAALTTAPHPGPLPTAEREQA